MRESGENNALQAAAAMQKGTVIDITTQIAMNASKLSIRHNLPMADSIILSTAQSYNCIIRTQDPDFENLPNVGIFPKA